MKLWDILLGKKVVKLLKRGVVKATGSSQLYPRQGAGKEAIIYEVYEIINKEAVLIVDEWNPFSTINQLAFFHNSKILCPLMRTYIKNGYSLTADLYIQGRQSIKSEEGTTQGDPRKKCNIRTQNSISPNIVK